MLRLHDAGGTSFLFSPICADKSCIYTTLMSKANEIAEETEKEQKEFERLGNESDKLLLAIDALNVEYERQRAKAELLVSTPHSY